MHASATGQDPRTVEEKVLGIVSEKHLRTSELMEEAGQYGLSSADVREAVWSLLDDGRISMAADRRLAPR